MTIKELHRGAIELADRAFITRFNGNIYEAKALFMEALALEREAAFLARNTRVGQPTESILFRSAATIAYHGDDLESARRLVRDCVVPAAPPEIEQECIDLLQGIKLIYLEMVENYGSEENARLTSTIRIADDIEISAFDLNSFAIKLSAGELGKVLDNTVNKLKVARYYRIDHSKKIAQPFRKESLSHIFNRIKHFSRKELART